MNQSECYIDIVPFMAEAQQLADTEDWGGDGFEEGFTRFVDALNSEAQLSPEGLARTRSHIRKLLVGRLKLFRDRRENPAITREEVRAPLVLTGQGRAGTSYFNALLAADPHNYAPLHWQVWNPSPPPFLPSTDSDAAIAVTDALMRFEGWQDPAVRATHNYASTNAAEDILIHEYSFRSGTFGFFWNVPSYAAWVYGTDLAPTYRMERMFLQALQHGCQRDQWAVKSPIHLGQLDYLMAEFPDARLAVNHRDPVKTLGSITSMLAAHRAQFGNAPVKIDRDFAQGAMENLAQNLEKLIARRTDPAFDKQICDITYVKLEADPLGEVAKFYAHHSIPLTQEARQSMEAHIANNRKGKFGAHRYDIEDTGLRIGEVRERFKFYTDHYDVPIEI